MREKNKDYPSFVLPVQMEIGSEKESEVTGRRNKERCAAFISRMIEKYGKEVLAEIEKESVQTEQNGKKTSFTN
ncbi:hypothetical protein [Porcincola intestinalis]|uniref:Uncharacterized protein n=1 Tax=Porcincola intestinalis TaxID=2606632 RepID=A0A6L5X0D3_9FIRM|nr:hypothetical protein [Porcincola intestinalis]MSS13801.1 hypothetical protein [Porcincola intestinalis]